jgi:hypothetical protein
MEKESLVITQSSHFHMLRHFSSVTDEQIDKFESEGITKATIDIEMSRPGSRFFAQFASNIEQLVNALFLYGFTSSIGNNRNLILHCTVPNSDFPKGIGSKGVVALDQLSSLERDLVYEDTNRGVALLHLKVENLPVCNDFTVILLPRDSHHTFITAFPGKPAMPLPDSSMNQLLFDKCKQFWSEHVFLIQQ